MYVIAKSIDEIDGCQAIYDVKNKKPGEPLHKKIIALIRDCDCVVVLITKESVRSCEVRDELTRAHELGRKIIPIKAEDFDVNQLPWFMQDLEYIPLQPEKFDDFVKELCDTLQNKVITQPSLALASNNTGLILAGGESRRWRASLIRHKHPSLAHFHWKAVNKVFAERGEDYRLPKPFASKRPLHKSCQPLHGRPPLQRAFLSFFNHGYKKVSVVVGDSAADPSQNEVRTYAALLNDPRFLQIRCLPSLSKFGIVGSLYAGLNAFRSYHGDVIVAYSDIVWPSAMMDIILRSNDADIIMLVDKDWRENYPKERIWHDELYAELAFGYGGSVEAAGEIVNLFGSVRPWDKVEDHDYHVDPFEELLEPKNGCAGEVVGLFKFSPDGRKAFQKLFRKIRQEGIPVPLSDLKLNYAPNISFDQTVHSIPLSDTLLATFLAYLAEQDKGISVRYVPTSNLKWFEIDHWGDAHIAQTDDRLKDCDLP